jgi:hypothetical protein
MSRLGAGELIPLFVCAAFLAWTVVRLSRPIDSKWADIVYRGGVRYMGVVGAIVMSLGICSEIYQRGNQAPPFLGMLFVVLFVTPLCLWAGYWGGRTIASIRGVQKP